ncbi:hypothetical protein CHS0354_028496 [Potamilus streckersoni]|uniref:Peptidoglycan-recognition protein n=1 Tax=Potamilus streckersoni TaxID=2493646 RepID=A0AAE0VV61_9BIVA|nr:hypothetical protein CHS0354_028496 [Potamilus streckersoni]
MPINIHAGPSHTSHTLTSLSGADCLTYNEHDEIGQDGITWANVDYKGQKAWIAKNYVNIERCNLDKQSKRAVQLPGCPHIVTRSEWGARAPTTTPGHLPATPKYAFIHHGASAPCHTKAQCIATVKSYQTHHIDSNHWSDIGYSFIIGEDGNVYEGRGWDEIGAHTLNYNSVGLGFCMIGNFMDRVPNDAALNAVKQLIACGVANNKLSSTYILHGHRDVGQTECPGNKLYDLIQSWPHYSRHQG